MDLRKLKTLIDLVSDSNVSELEITEAEGKVRIVKSGAEVAHQAYLPAMQMQMAAMQQQPVAAAPVAAAAPAAPRRRADQRPALRSARTGQPARPVPVPDAEAGEDGIDAIVPLLAAAPDARVPA